jgi:hypothetical protein
MVPRKIIRRDAHLVIDEGGEGKKIEEVGEESPDISVSILAETFVVETVYLGYLPRFMISTKDGYSVTIA